MLLTELVDWFPENHCCWTTLIGKYLSIFGKTMRKHGQPILWILLLGNICLYLEKTLRKHRQPIIRILFDKRRSLMIKLGQVPK